MSEQEQDRLAVYREAGVEIDPEKRWGEGLSHHPASLALVEEIKALDFAHGDGLCLKTGGDGDNGERLLYLLDAFFECREAPTEGDIEAELGQVCSLGYMSKTMVDFARALRVTIEEQTRNELGDSALIGVLCESARCLWELTEARRKPPEDLAKRNRLLTEAAGVLRDVVARIADRGCFWPGDHCGKCPHCLCADALSEAEKILRRGRR